MLCSMRISRKNKCILGLMNGMCLVQSVNQNWGASMSRLPHSRSRKPLSRSHLAGGYITIFTWTCFLNRIYRFVLLIFSYNVLNLIISLLGGFILHEYFFIRAAFRIKVRYYRGKKLFPKDGIQKKCLPLPRQKKSWKWAKIGIN